MSLFPLWVTHAVRFCYWNFFGCDSVAPSHNVWRRMVFDNTNRLYFLKQLYTADSLDISERVGYHAWHLYGSLYRMTLFKNTTCAFWLIFWFCSNLWHCVKLPLVQPILCSISFTPTLNILQLIHAPSYLRCLLFANSWIFKMKWKQWWRIPWIQFQIWSFCLEKINL